MIHSLENVLLARLIARFDAINEPIPPSSKDALLGAMRAAGWRPAAPSRNGPGLLRPRSDLELARAMRDGDSVAAEELFIRHRGKLVAYARSVANPHDAEDFVQIVFIALLTTAPLSSLDFDVRAYMFKVVRNQAIKHTFARAREPGLDDSAAVPDDEARSQLDQLITQHELTRVAELAEAHCTPAEQAVLALTHAGRDGAEIADEMDISVGYARVIRHRGLAKLRAAFAGDPS